MLAFQQEKKHTDDGEYVFSVRELNTATRDLLEGHFQVLWVSGEISNLVLHGSGHIYFSLKDEQAQIRCAWFRGKQGPTRFKIENGQQVLVRALVTLYPERGDYQLVVEKVELAGIGLLQQQLEALKRKLNAQGLFDQKHKKALPPFPKTIGIITSPTGAALQDMLNVLKRRAPFIGIRVYPCLVQGEGAAKSISKAIMRADLEKKCEVLVLARGGGSLEDLWAFNDEALAIAVFACELPIVSAVGHEIDFSISDFVADLRAPTPSAAAELISPDLFYLLDILNKKSMHLTFLIKRSLENYSYSVDQISRMLKHPKQRLEEQKLKLQFYREKIHQVIHSLVTKKAHRLELAKHNLTKNAPSIKIEQNKQLLSQKKSSLNFLVARTYAQKNNSFLMQVEKLETLSPMGILRRGYAIAYSADKKVVDSITKVAAQDELRVRIQDGTLVCQVKNIES